MYKLGDIVLARVQFTDTFEVKTRPAVVLFEELGNIVIAGITSNTKMKGILIEKKFGLPKDSVIKLNYIFTISAFMIKKKITELPENLNETIVKEIIHRLKS